MPPGTSEQPLRFGRFEISPAERALRTRGGGALLGAALQPYAEAGYRNPSQSEALLERLSTLSRQAIGDTAFEQAEAAGRVLDLHTAMLELGQWLERGA